MVITIVDDLASDYCILCIHTLGRLLLSCELVTCINLQTNMSAWSMEMNLNTIHYEGTLSPHELIR